jgi:hypothetical protein
VFKKILSASALLVLGIESPFYAAPRDLGIYWVDAAGGASTLVYTGNRRPDNRDANRIFAAAQAAGLKKLDCVLVTHHNGDHINNGATKGGPISVFETLRKSSGLGDILQVPLALNTPKGVNTDERMIANMGPIAEWKGERLKASVDSRGQFARTNLRNGFSKTYQ